MQRSQPLARARAVEAAQTDAGSVTSVQLPPLKRRVFDVNVRSTAPHAPLAARARWRRAARTPRDLRTIVLRGHPRPIRRDHRWFRNKGTRRRMMKMQEQPALCDLPIAGRQAQFGQLVSERLGRGETAAAVAAAALYSLHGIVLRFGAVWCRSV